MKKLVLLRGPSGTGKSTIGHYLAKRTDEEKYGSRMGMLYTPQATFHETDQFFTDTTGKYHFTIAKLSAAHKWNQLQTERSMLHEVPLVIVANTFVALWEMEKYLELAAEYNYEVEIIKTPGPWDPNVLFTRNNHNVPLDVIKRHVNSYQPHEKDAEWTDMSIFQA